jgi:hypothetical protein
MRGMYLSVVLIIRPTEMSVLWDVPRLESNTTVSADPTRLTIPIFSENANALKTETQFVELIIELT